MEGSRDEESVRSLVPWRSSTLYVILASSLMGVMGVSLISPVLPDLRPVFDVSDAEVGLFITAYTLPGIFITPFIGLLADRIGRKRVLVPLLFTFGVAGAGIGFTTDFTAPQLVALGFVAYGASLLGVWLAPSAILVAVALLVFGVGFGVVMPSIDTTMVTLVSEDLRAGMMGMRTSVLRLGQTLGPIGFTFAAETFFVTTVRGYRVLLLLAGSVVIVSGILAYASVRD